MANNYDERIRTDPRIPESEREATIRQFRLESGNYNPDVLAGRRRSSAGARGLAQFMDQTRKDYPHDPSNPDASLNAGIQYMGDLSKQFAGNWQLARLAYNWGPGNVKKWLANGGDMSQLPPETRNYHERTSATASAPLGALGGSGYGGDFGFGRGMGMLRQLGLLGADHPAPNLDAMFAPLQQAAAADVTQTQDAYENAQAGYKHTMDSRSADYEPERRYGGWQSALGSLGSNIASAISGNERFANQTQAKLMGDELMARQEGIQKRTEALQFSYDNLARARDRFTEAGKHKQATDASLQMAKIQADMDKARNEVNFEQDIAKIGFQELMRAQGDLERVLASAGVVRTEDGQYKQVGKDKLARGEKGRLPSTNDMEKTQAELIKAVLDPKLKKMDPGAVAYAKSKLIQSLGTFTDQDDVMGPVARMRSMGGAIASLLDVPPEQVNKAIKVQHQLGVMQELEFSERDGKETVPGLVKFAVERGWISPQRANAIEEWNGKGEIVPAEPPSSGGGGRVDEDGNPMSTTRETEPTAPKAEAPAKATPSAPKTGGGEERYKQEQEEQRIRSRVKLEQKGPPAAPDLTGMTYDAQLRAEVKHAEAQLQYYTQLYQAGGALDEKKIAEIRTELRKLRKEQDSYERAQRKDRAIPPGNKQ